MLFYGERRKKIPRDRQDMVEVNQDDESVVQDPERNESRNLVEQGLANILEIIDKDNMELQRLRQENKRLRNENKNLTQKVSYWKHKMQKVRDVCDGIKKDRINN